jgi:hypothetical protein
LQDLSLIALTFSKQAVQQRLTFKPNPKGQNTAPVVFQHDPNGDLIELALELRTVSLALVPDLARPPKDSSLAKEEDFDDAEFTKTFFVEPKADRILRKQKEKVIEEFITGCGDPSSHPGRPKPTAAPSSCTVN